MSPRRLRDRLRGLAKQLRALVDKDGLERQLDEEIEFHVARETELNVAAGMDPEETRRPGRCSPSAAGSASRRRSGTPGRALLALLYGVSPLDPVTYVGVVVLLVAVAAAACALPAWSAARLDPSRTLRAE